MCPPSVLLFLSVRETAKWHSTLWSPSRCAPPGVTGSHLDHRVSPRTRALREIFSSAACVLCAQGGHSFGLHWERESATRRSTKKAFIRRLPWRCLTVTPYMGSAHEPELLQVKGDTTVSENDVTAATWGDGSQRSCYQGSVPSARYSLQQQPAAVRPHT